MIAFFTNKYVLSALAALAIVAAALGYRAHLIDLGAAQEATAAKARQTAAVLAAHKTDEATTARVTADLNHRLFKQQEHHDRITSDLQAALDASNLRAARLDRRVAGLLDRAAGVRAGTPTAPSGTGGAPGKAAADQAVAAAPGPDASVADLVESVDTNYAICKRNATRLGALQTWYQQLRAGRADPAAPPAE